jgi:hypothetical protein
MLPSHLYPQRSRWSMWTFRVFTNGSSLGELVVGMGLDGSLSPRTHVRYWDSDAWDYWRPILYNVPCFWP